MTTIPNFPSAPPASRPAAGQWWLTAVLTIVATMAVIDRTILSLLFDPIRADLHLSDTQMSLIFGSAFALANVFCTLPAGYLADRISRRGMITLGAIIWSAMTSLHGFANGFVQLIAARAAVGSAEAVIHPCSYSLLRATLTEKRRGRGFAIYSMSIMAGSALGFLIGGVLIFALDSRGISTLPWLGDVKPWRLVMVLLGLIGIPVALLTLTIKEPRREQSDSAPAPSIRIAIKHLRSNWRLYLPVVAFSSTLAMQSNAYAAFIASVPLRRWDYSVRDVGTYLGIIMLVMGPIGNWLVGMTMDAYSARLGVRGLAIVGSGVAAIMCLFSSWAPAAPSAGWYFVIVGVVFTFGGAGFAVTGAIIAALTPARIVGQISAIQLFIYGVVGMGSGPAVVGFVSDSYFSGSRSGISLALSRCCFAFTFASLLSMLLLVHASRNKPTFQPAQ